MLHNRRSWLERVFSRFGTCWLQELLRSETFEPPHDMTLFNVARIACDSDHRVVPAGHGLALPRHVWIARNCRSRDRTPEVVDPVTSLSKRWCFRPLPYRQPKPEHRAFTCSNRKPMQLPCNSTNCLVM
jgi:hypothetical protein